MKHNIWARFNSMTGTPPPAGYLSCLAAAMPLPGISFLAHWLKALYMQWLGLSTFLAFSPWFGLYLFLNITYMTAAHLCLILSLAILLPLSFLSFLLGSRMPFVKTARTDSHSIAFCMAFPHIPAYKLCAAVLLSHVTTVYLTFLHHCLHLPP